MSVSLPRELDYTQLQPTLGNDSTNLSHFILPSNGSSFSTISSSNLVTFDLPSSGFLDPKSVYLKYKYKITSTGETRIRGCPVTSSLQRFQVMFGSNIVENINNYNVIEHMKSNVMLDISQKNGNSIS